MKKIGILLESTTCSQYFYNTVRELAESDQIELFFLLNSPRESQQGFFGNIKSTLESKGIVRFLDLVVFKLVSIVELKLLSMFSAKCREHGRVMNIAEFNQNDITYLEPRFSPSGLVVRYTEDSVERVRSLELDLILRGNAPGIFKGEILNSAKDGVISFHHGDNRWNRGSPVAFWEVYWRKPSTGFVIQILTEQLDGGAVIFRGNVATLRSFGENTVNIYRESNPFLAKLILQYAARGRFPAAGEALPFGGSLLVVPTAPQMLLYLLRTGLLFFRLIVRRQLFRKTERWGVAYSAGSWRGAILRKGTEIKNPPGRFLADPFVVTRENRSICFLEDYDYKLGRACISAVELIDGKKYEILGPVVEEPFHLSFPFLFEYQQDLYMVPEASGSNSIRLYKCVEFPMKWEYSQDLMSEVNASDSIVFEHGERWWLLTNEAVKGSSDHCSQLTAYYREHPLSGEWIPHEQNPLVLDSEIGRNGGMLDVKTDSPIRCRQRQDFDLYGASLSLAKISELTPTSYREEEICRIAPDFIQGIKGCHHMHSDERYTVFDFVRFEKTN